VVAHFYALVPYLRCLVLNMDFEDGNDNPPDLVAVSDKGPEGSNALNGQSGNSSITKVPITIVTGRWNIPGGLYLCSSRSHAQVILEPGKQHWSITSCMNSMGRGLRLYLMACTNPKSEV